QLVLLGRYYPAAAILIHTALNTGQKQLQEKENEIELIKELDNLDDDNQFNQLIKKKLLLHNSEFEGNAAVVAHTQRAVALVSACVQEQRMKKKERRIDNQNDSNIQQKDDVKKLDKKGTETQVGYTITFSSNTTAFSLLLRSDKKQSHQQQGDILYGWGPGEAIRLAKIKMNPEEYVGAMRVWSALLIRNAGHIPEFNNIRLGSMKCDSLIKQKYNNSISQQDEEQLFDFFFQIPHSVDAPICSLQSEQDNNSSLDQQSSFGSTIQSLPNSTVLEDDLILETSLVSLTPNITAVTQDKRIDDCLKHIELEVGSDRSLIIRNLLHGQDDSQMLEQEEQIENKYTSNASTQQIEISKHLASYTQKFFRLISLRQGSSQTAKLSFQQNSTSSQLTSFPGSLTRDQQQSGHQIQQIIKSNTKQIPYLRLPIEFTLLPPTNIGFTPFVIPQCFNNNDSIQQLGNNQATVMPLPVTPDQKDSNTTEIRFSQVSAGISQSPFHPAISSHHKITNPDGPTPSLDDAVCVLITILDAYGAIKLLIGQRRMTQARLLLEASACAGLLAKDDLSGDSEIGLVLKALIDRTGGI
ncbi:MAG: hypothetical protein EZS28_025508, partial [Streblomastix strix]